MTLNRLSAGQTANVTALLLGGAMVLFGVWRGEAGVVLSKAIRLCMECVGIG